MILLNIFVAILMDGYAEATEEGNVCVCERERGRRVCHVCTCVLFVFNCIYESVCVCVRAQVKIAP